MVKNLPAMQKIILETTQEMQVPSLVKKMPWKGNGNPILYSCLVPKIEEPGGLQSEKSQRVKHNLVTKQQ